jgi:flagellar hook-associated protein 1 FlgK
VLCERACELTVEQSSAANADDERRRGVEVSGFSSLNTASTALRAQQRAIDVTGQNVANVNTDGYSRQRAELRSIGANTVPAIHSTGNGVGGGVTADQVSRIRDAFLDSRAQVEHATSARLTVESSTLTQVEDAFGEPGTTGIQSMLAGMWSGFEAVANAPGNLAARSQLLERAGTLAAGVRTTSATLEQQWDGTRESLQALVSDVNSATDSIARLNEAIRSATQAGQPVNELSDQRDQLVLSLSDKIGATSSPADFGQVNVLVGGTSLVSGSTSLALRLTGSTTARGAAGDPPAILTSPGNSVLRVDGTAAGQLAALSATLPHYLDELDGFATALAGAVNGQHRAGTDLDGVAGGDLFGSADGAPLTAANFGVRITDVRALAAASTPTASLDNSNADALSQLGLTSGLDASYRQVITALGVNAAVSGRNVGIQAVVTAQVDRDRESVSGVSLDEEMTNMLAYQHGYQAAARMVTTVDEMLDVLINRTGRVGL